VPQGSAWNVEWMTGREKTARVLAYALDGAAHPFVRRVAVDLVRSCPRDAHLDRVERFHRFVRDAVPYHREPIEMLHPAAQVLMEGGDCDDHVILLCALAWSLRYPIHVEAVGHPDGPGHYTCRIGTPPADEPEGDASTTWRSYETTIDALPGEHVSAAVRRLGY
jgi:hypothetical protein